MHAAHWREWDARAAGISARPAGPQRLEARDFCMHNYVHANILLRHKTPQ